MTEEELRKIQDLVGYEQTQANYGLGEQLSPDNAEPMQDSPYLKTLANRQAQAAPDVSQPSAIGGIGGKATQIGAVSGQPELMAAGLALQTMGGIQDRAQNQRNAQYQAEVAKINARQNAINRMAQIGAGLKA